MARKPKIACEICKKLHRKSRMIPLSSLNDDFITIIKETHPDVKKGSICLKDFNRITIESLKDNLEEEKGSLSEVEKDIVESLEDNDIIAKNINEIYTRQLTWSEKISDRIAEFGGSWTFIIIFLLFMLVWIIINLSYLANPVDPYPFILLNLFLSTIAAIQAPIILMSQNRQAEKDRFEAEQDYKTNLKAELQIQQISAKLNHLMEKQLSMVLDNQEKFMQKLDGHEKAKRSGN